MSTETACRDLRCESKLMIFRLWLGMTIERRFQGYFRTQNRLAARFLFHRNLLHRHLKMVGYIIQNQISSNVMISMHMDCVVLAVVYTVHDNVAKAVLGVAVARRIFIMIKMYCSHYRLMLCERYRNSVICPSVQPMLSHTQPKFPPHPRIDPRIKEKSCL